MSNLAETKQETKQEIKINKFKSGDKMCYSDHKWYLIAYSKKELIKTVQEMDKVFNQLINKIKKKIDNKILNKKKIKIANITEKYFDDKYEDMIKETPINNHGGMDTAVRESVFTHLLEEMENYLNDKEIKYE